MKFFQRFEKMSETKKEYLFFFLLMFIGIVIYFPSFQIPFFSDEVAFIKRNTVSSFSQLLHLFDKKDYDGFYYRPFGNFVSGSLTYFAGENALLCRVFNILIHILNAFIFFKFVKIISKRFGFPALAYASAILFLVFPGNDYAILWHTALFDRLLFGVYFLGLISFVKDFKVSLLSIFFFILAMLSKEAAFSFPFIIFIADYFLNEKEHSLIASVKKSGVYFLILIGFLLLRIVLFNNNVFIAQDAHSGAGLFTIIKNYFFFLGFLLFPFSPREVQQILLAHQSIVLFAAGICLLGMMFLLIKKKSDKVFWFFLSFVLVTILPSSRLFMRWYLYLPSAGFILFGCYLLFTFQSKKRKALHFSLLAVFLIYTFSLVHKELVWLDITSRSAIALNNVSKECEISSCSSLIFFTIPAKVDDVPVFQLQFETLARYYLKSEMEIQVLSKTYLSNWNDQIEISMNEKRDVVLTQNKDNYFILFDNKKNINFDLKTGKQLSFPLNPAKGTMYVFFSKGKFHKITGQL